MDEARTLLGAGRLDEALAVLDALEPASDRAGAERDALRAHVLAHRHELDRALAEADRVAATARAQGWYEVEAAALMARMSAGGAPSVDAMRRLLRRAEHEGDDAHIGELRAMLGVTLVEAQDPVMAVEVLRLALDGPLHPRSRAIALRHLGTAGRRSGDLEASMHALQDARKVAQEHGLDAEDAEALYHWALVAAARGDDAGAADLVAASVRAYRRLGMPHRASRGTLALAHMARRVGRFDDAIAALDMAERGTVPASRRANLKLARALVALDRRDFDGAATTARQALEADARGVSAATAHAVLLACEPHAFAQHRAALTPMLDRGLFQSELPEVLIVASERLPPDEAVLTLRMAWEQWRRAEDPRAAEVLDRARRARTGGGRAVAGAFQLRTALGEGAQAVVMRAVHAVTGAEVALKLLKPGPAAGTPGQELRSAARLDHHGVAWLVDTGTITPFEAALHPACQEGCAWLAFERIDGPTLLESCGAVEWPEARTLILGILEALAYAHSRGLMHLDLKPSNVMIRPDGTPTLVDFGLSINLVRRAREHVAGTPAYMAPEQFVRDWRGFGPATDLYAVGGLMVALVTGATPFSGETLEDYREAHLHQPLPPLQPSCAVPEGLVAWLRRIMAKAPGDRYALAPEAARALEALGPAVALGAAAAVTAPLPEEETEVIPQASSPQQRVLRHPGFDRRGPVPLTWLWGEAVQRERTLAAAGSRLDPHRGRELVGRHGERDLLWSLLRDVHQTGTSRCAVLTGTRGAGASRLARWLAQRATEVAAAWPILAHLRPGEPPVEGLARGLRVWIGGDGLDADGLALHLERLVPDDPTNDLLAQAAEAHSPVADDIRTGLLLAAIEQTSRELPIILVLDLDADGEGAPRLLEAVRLRLGAAASVLYVVVLPSLDAPSQALTRDAHAVVRLGRQPEAELATALDRRLPLTQALRAAITGRAAGLPGVAHQLLTGLVRRGRLVLTDAGWDLAPGAEVRLADEDVEHVHTTAERALAGLPAATVRAAWAAVLLGPRVLPQRWRALCEALALREDRTGLDRLRNAGLLHEDSDSWGIVPALTQAMQERATTAQHQACADVLAADGALAEAARHHEATGALEQALALLVKAVEQASDGGDDAGAAMLQARAAALVSRIGPAAATAQAELALQQAVALLRARKLDDAEALIDIQLDAAWDQGWTQIEVRALYLLAHVAWWRGDKARSERLAERAVARAAQLPAAIQLKPMLFLSAFHAADKSPAEADQRLIKLNLLARGTGDARLAAETAYHVAVHRSLYNLPGAVEALDYAEQAMVDVGRIVGRLYVWRHRGTLALGQRRWDEADAWMQRAEKGMLRCGQDAYARSTRQARIEVAMKRGHLDRARQMADDLGEVLDPRDAAIQVWRHVASDEGSWRHAVNEAEARTPVQFPMGRTFLEHALQDALTADRMRRAVDIQRLLGALHEPEEPGPVGPDTVEQG